ncbi:replication-associated protein [Switchgrass mosaic-associated virus 1]|uniref:Replication-associated protein n=1 Tax=Switchgrass mosaic-associated virus 1 TaxID=1571533 RepID=A0A0A0QUB0_9GEMI|nr:replication-associated protein [Switchgrass mosaic-associated virus 1]AIT39768.1 replication-associated protein [Switchgrass mosaic-associated virus 1]
MSFSSDSADGGIPNERRIHPGSNFKFDSNEIFLTYPRCSAEPMDVGNYLWTLLLTLSPKYVLCTRERHADGTFHLHAFVQLGYNLVTANPHHLDYRQYHPNVQPVRSSRSVRDYCLKNPIDQYTRGRYSARTGVRNGSTSRMGESAADWESKNQKMATIFATATSRDEYLSLVKTTFPFDWATKLQAFEYSASKLFPEVEPEYETPDWATQLRCPERIADWANHNVFQVSPAAYSILHPTAGALSDLEWLVESSRMMAQEERASTSAAQQGQERPHGRGL